MKKCPYCAESINADAIKCRYCGEWLNSQNKPSNIFSNITNWVDKGISNLKEIDKQRRKEKEENRRKEILAKKEKYSPPTNNKPLVIGSFEFYHSFFEKDKVRHSYEGIAAIKIEGISRSVHGIPSGKNMNANLYLTENKKDFEPQSYDKNYFLQTTSILGIGNESFKYFQYVIDYIQRRTFPSRLSRYWYFIRKDGGFSIDSYFIHQNGDISLGKDGKLLNNIISANENELIEYGNVIWKSLNRSTTYLDFGRKVAKKK